MVSNHTVQTKRRDQSLYRRWQLRWIFCTSSGSLNISVILHPKWLKFGLSKIFHYVCRSTCQVSACYHFNRSSDHRCVLTTLAFLANKVTCREYKVGEKGGKGFGCPRKKRRRMHATFWGWAASRADLTLFCPIFKNKIMCTQLT